MKNAVESRTLHFCHFLSPSHLFLVDFSLFLFFFLLFFLLADFFSSSSHPFSDLFLCVCYWVKMDLLLRPKTEEKYPEGGLGDGREQVKCGPERTVCWSDCSPTASRTQCCFSSFESHPQLQKHSPISLHVCLYIFVV